MSDKRRDDYIELVLDTTGGAPQLLGRSEPRRGRRRHSDRARLNRDGPTSRADGRGCAGFVLNELEPFVER